MHNFLLLGGDSRQLYLNRILDKNGFSSTLHFDKNEGLFSIKEAVETNDVLLCPIPFTKDKINLFSENGLTDLGIGKILELLTSRHTLFGGNIPVSVKEYAKAQGAACFDYMEMEEITVKNAVATAEGAIAEAIGLSPDCLHKSKCLVTGFGRCGKILSLKLKGLEAKVTIADQKETQLANALSMGFDGETLENLSEYIGKYQFIFNTIPAPIFGKELISGMNPEVTVIDIASAPGGVDFDFCRQQNLRAKLCPGLPGIYGPKTSAEILYQGIVKHLS